LIAFLIFFVRSVEAETPSFGWASSYLYLFPTTCRALTVAFYRQIAECLEGTSMFSPQADGGDGGGDGGGGDGGGGDGGDGGASNSGGDGDGNGDAAAGDTGAPGDPGDPGNSDNATDNSPASDPSDPSEVSAIDNTVPDVPTNDPTLGLRGPNPQETNNADDFAAVGSVALEPPQTGSDPIPGSGVNVGINAIIVSGTPTSWSAVGKAPGVQNVTVTGGIIALGEPTISKPTSGRPVALTDSPPEWLKLRPDWRYLNGSVFPPVIPNVIDIRTISNTEEVIESSSN
jgi:hypothetical protein